MPSRATVGHPSEDVAALVEAAAEARREAEAAARRYERLVEAFPGIVYRLELLDDGTMVPIYVSPQIDSMLGVSVAAWESEPGVVMEIVHPDDRDIMGANSEIVRRNDGEIPDFRMVATDGRVVWMRSLVNVFHEDGRTYLQGMLIDVTALKTAEAARDAMEAELRLAQKLEAVGQLAAGVAHEINTPVQYVGDTIRFLDEAYGDLWEVLGAHEELLAAARSGTVPAQLVERVDEARDVADVDYLRERVPAAFERSLDGVERVATIVRAMREFARAPSGDAAPVDVNEVLRNTLIVARNEYKYVAEIEAEYGAVPRIVADVGGLGQVFLNLVVNAGHAIEDARSEGDPLGTIRVTTRVDGDDIAIDVADTGCGMPPEVAERVFDPFFTTKEVGRGTGQGLGIARRIVVDRHGGTLTFDTTPGAGTTFHVRLPIAAPARD